MNHLETTDFINLPVYKKALELFKVSRAIACSISDNKNVWEMNLSGNYHQQYAGDLMSDTLRLAPSLAILQNASNPTIRLKRAKNIRRAINNIALKCRKLEFSGIKEKEFISLLKAEIHQFDHLFSEWVHHLQFRKDN
ncbi:hypothetical protein L1I30_10320 [Gillisia sp. M10.2A]|uniref:Four helix bundle protein n=1 Tax=Gillisia lutea TaxID=2909668 RepID=A0ABS9EGR9_9FLAO|nr:hypothetical protein [Gillisia lutea]MCF4102062.1 hypothetical protein [Gillisia lutea]